MGLILVGGWYLQSSLMEEQHHNMEQAGQIEKLKHALIEEQYYRMVHTEEIEKLTMSINTLNDTIKRLASDNGKVRTHAHTVFPG